MKEIKIGRFIIKDLRPIRSNFINVNGNFSAYGFIKKRKVKVYSPNDENQINLRLKISNSNLSKYFPKLITFNKNFIVEEWIDGQTLKDKRISEIKKKMISNRMYLIIKELKKLSFNNIAFDYIGHIYARSGKKRDKLFYKLKKLPIYVNHNDLTLSNIILQKNRLYIIDNEFLGYNNGWILNLKNSFLSERNTFYENKIDKEDIQKLWTIRNNWKKSFRVKLIKSAYSIKEKLLN